MCILTEIQSVSDAIWSALKENNIQYLKATEFRIIINSYKKLQITLTPHSDTFIQLSNRLLLVLISGELKLDCQIVASTAYCLTLIYQYDFETVSDKIHEISTNSMEFIETKEYTDLKKYDMVKICLFHGILQCNEFWFKPSNSSSVNKLLNNEIFPVVKKLCFEYNNLCLISFKVLVNLIKKINTLNQHCVCLTENNFTEVMNIIMSNWENPLSGIREQNLLVFEQLLMSNNDCWHFLPVDSTILEINNLCPLIHLILTEHSWMMKSKYFLLSAVLRIYGVKKIMSVYGEDIVSGLLMSLRYTQLVSAGSDLYQAITSTYTFDQWQNTFLTPISETLTQSSNKLITENVINYWLPYTVKKYPPSLNCLIGKISTIKNNINLFSYISLMKLARKEGFDFVNWDNLKCCPLLFPALLSDCEKVRAQAFNLICVTSKLSVPPNKDEIKLVQMFLHQNINVDNAAMRQNLLNAFTIFIQRLKDSSLKEIKKEGKNDDKKYPVVNECLNFLEWLYLFIKSNLQFECNYQRKFTSLQIYNTVLNAFCFKYNTVSQENRKDDELHIFLNIGRTNGKWKFTLKESQNMLINNIYDPSDDIRKISAEILTFYFYFEESEIIYYKELAQNALKLCKNPIFHQAESGALLLQTVTNLISNSACLIKEKIVCDILGNSKSVLDYLIKSLEEQFKDFSQDMLGAVINGSSLYGFLSVLEILFSQHSCLEYQNLPNDQIERIICLIENIISLLLNVLSTKSDTSSDFAPSFAEMGEAIALLVQQSSVVCEEIQYSQLSEGFDLVENSLEDLQLTPAQQLILNCIWHNMKVSCSIASKLIISSSLSSKDAERCMDLLCLVLCKCRHKGAIESAGLALYQATKFLTSANKLEFQAVPREFILKFLNSLVSANSTTISRRSAGLAILVHRIAAGDMESGKPLLHICVSRFIKAFEDFKEPTELTLADLPQSRALHFLQTLVQDSSLRQEMTKYIVQISLLCFANLGSSVWTLRNAALQLFGALLPKLTGQKKLQENESHLAIEELYFHIKPLFEMISKEVSAASTTNCLQIHSRMIPLLTLLSNLTVSFQSFINLDLRKLCNQFFDQFQCLFKSEIYKIRDLSAKTNARFCLPSEICSRIQERIKEVLDYLTEKTSVIKTNNELHGYLINIKYLVGYFNEAKIGNKTLCSQDKSLKSCLQSLNVINTLNLANQQSLLYNEILEITRELYNKSCLTVNEITDILTNIPVIFGINRWADFNLHCLITSCDSETIKSDLKHFIFSTKFDIQMTCLNALKTRINTRDCRDEFEYIFKILNDVLYNVNCKSQVVEMILEIMLEILNNEGIFSLNVNIDNVYFNVLYDLKYGSKSSVTVLPVICGIVSKQACQFSFLDQICSEIFRRSNPINNEELRLSAAKSLLFIFPTLKNKCDGNHSAGSYIWKSAVSLVQDEDKEVRLEVSKFIFNFFRDEFDGKIPFECKLCSPDLFTIKNCNPFVAFESLFTRTCLSHFMSEKDAVVTMWEMLTYDESRLFSNIKRDILNPFCNDKSNIYAEEVKLLDMMQHSISTLLETLSEENFVKVKDIILHQMDLRKKEFEEEIPINDGVKFKKISCQLHIAQLLKAERIQTEFSTI